MTALELNSAQRKKLRGLAHGLKPLATIGRRGLTESVVAEIDSVLDHHELIKVRLGEGADLKKAEKRALCAEIASQLGASVAGIVGHVGILYRPARDEDRRRIRV